MSAFLNAKIDRILELQPDCVFGFSDLQADIAAALIRAGVQVTVFNQRSVEEVFSMLFQVAAMVGCAEDGLARIAVMRQRLDGIRTEVAALVASGKRRPRAFFEEWDEPHISGIRWVSELLGIAGGDDVFPELALQSLGELLSRGLQLPFPGPVIGMVLLLVALRWQPVRTSVAAVAEFLLAHLSLLFVPVGVGVMTHLGLFSRYGLRMALIIVLSTCCLLYTSPSPRD